MSAKERRTPLSMRTDDGLRFWRYVGRAEPVPTGCLTACPRNASAANRAAIDTRPNCACARAIGKLFEQRRRDYTDRYRR